MKDWDLYFITDSRLTRKSVLEDVEAAIEGGCRVVQYREKNLSSSQMLSTALEIKGLCSGRAAFIVDDRLDICLASQADGLHVGSDDLPVEVIRKFLPDAIVGYTVHSIDDVAEAQKLDVDYLSLGHIFPTTTKPHSTPPLGLETLYKARAMCRLPLVAIGGINAGNVSNVISAGADSAAMISAIVSSKNVKTEVENVRKIISDAKKRLIVYGNTA